MKNYRVLAVFLAETYQEIFNQVELLKKSPKDNNETMVRLEYDQWKLDLVKRTMDERLNEAERPIFRLIYGRHLTFREVREFYKMKTGRNLLNPQIIRTKRHILSSLAMEIQFCDTYEEEHNNVVKLEQEFFIWLSSSPQNQKKISKA